MSGTLKKDSFSLLLALILLSVSMLASFISDTVINYKHYISLTIVLLSVYLYFINKKLYKYVFGTTLLLGSVNLLSFFYIETLLFIGPVGFNIISILILILFLGFNKEFIHGLFSKTTLKKEPHNDSNLKIKKQVKRFEQKFQNKSKSDLKKIINPGNIYTEEARMAAKNLLERITPE